MNFLSNLFNRLTGRKKKDEEGNVVMPGSQPVPIQPQTVQPQPTQPVPQPQPQPQPQPIAPPVETIAPAPQTMGVVDSLKSAANDTKNLAKFSTIGAQGIYNNWLRPIGVGVDASVRAMDSDVNFNQALEKARHDAPLISTGTAGIDSLIKSNVVPARIPYGGGRYLDTSRTAKNLGELGGILATLPAQAANPLAFNEIKALSKAPALAKLGGYGVVRAGQAIPAGILHRAAQDGQTAADVFSPKKITTDAALGFGLNTLASPKLVGEAIGNAKNSMLRVAPGVTSMNPEKVSQAENVAREMFSPKPVATMTPPIDNPTAGQLNQPTFDNPGTDALSTIEEALQDIPALQRVRATQALDSIERMAEAPGLQKVTDINAPNRPVQPQGPTQPVDGISPGIKTQPEITPVGPTSMNDLNPHTMTPDEVQNFHYEPNQPTPPPSQINIRPVGGDIAAPPRVQTISPSDVPDNTPFNLDNVPNPPERNVAPMGGEVQAPVNQPEVPTRMTPQEQLAENIAELERRTGKPITAPESPPTVETLPDTAPTRQPEPAIEQPVTRMESDIPATQNAPESPSQTQTPVAEEKAAKNAVEEARTLNQGEGELKEGSGKTVDDMAQKMADTPNQPQKPAAPLTHDSLVKSLDDGSKNLKGKYAMRDATTIEERKLFAARHISDLSDDELLHAFQTTSTETMADNPNKMALAGAALERLDKMSVADPKNEVLSQAIQNVLEGMDKGTSGAGNLLRFSQESFDKMPIPSKVRFMVKSIDKANKNVEGYSPLRERPGDASVVDAAFTNEFRKIGDISDEVAKLEAKYQAILDNKDTLAPKGRLKSIGSKLADARQRLLEQNASLVDLFHKQTPGKSRVDIVTNDYPRMAMLSSAAGRVNDLVETGANALHEGTTDFTNALINKAINAVKGKGTLSDTSKGQGEVLSGVGSGLKKVWGKLSGKNEVSDIQSAIKNRSTGRSEMRASGSLLSKVVHALTEAPTDLSHGVVTKRIYQLADQEAAQQGLTGALRKQYAEARSNIPTRDMVNKGNEVGDAVNSLNKNFLSDKAGALRKAIIGKDLPVNANVAQKGMKAVQNILGNNVLAFTQWAGGHAWNTITDRNVVANAVKATAAFAKGDVEAGTRQLAKLANGSAVFAAGYQLSKSGVITTENAEGYSGMYLHVKDNYVNIDILGAFAPNLVLAAAYEKATSDNGADGSAVGKFFDVMGRYAKGNLSLGGMTGVENNVVRSYQVANQHGNNAVDGVANFVSGAAGQFIPAAFGDANSFLDNHTSLNPTKEAADTKAVKDQLRKDGTPSTAKDIPATSLNKIINRLPFASQLALPRKAGVAAKNEFNRITRGDRDTDSSKQGRADAETAKAAEKTTEERSKDFSSRSVPDPESKVKGYSFDDAVASRISSGKYDQAVEGLQADLDDYNKNPEINPNKVKEKETKISRLKVAQSRGIKPEVYKQYFGSAQDGITSDEWKKLGDPKSEDYNPEMYQALWEVDSDMAAAGVSKNTMSGDKNYYTQPKKGSGSGGGSKGSKISGNTIGSVASLGKITLNGLTPKQTGVSRLPRIDKIRPNELVKKRKISVSK